MTTKTAKTEMLAAHEAMAAVLDSKIGNMKEWQAFRAIDRALLALEQPTIIGVSQTGHKVRPQRDGASPSYMSLAYQALTEADKPVPTDKIMEFISARRPLSGDDPAKAKIVVQSSLSKDSRFKSVPWEGKRAWWFTDRGLPKWKPEGVKPPPVQTN
jgi:hypothetical protein